MALQNRAIEQNCSICDFKEQCYAQTVLKVANHKSVATEILTHQKFLSSLYSNLTCFFATLCDTNFLKSSLKIQLNSSYLEEQFFKWQK